jgi:uncharacterized damage-inducible protein DinB
LAISRRVAAISAISPAGRMRHAARRMDPTDPYPLLARFNRWVNRRFYGLMAGLPDAERKRDRGAFFGSIHNTLNHLLVVDRLWLDRLEGRSNDIARLDTVLHDGFEPLAAERATVDERLIAYVDGLDATALAKPLRYRFISGTEAETPLHLVLITLFNHQTHHRGQVHALLTQLGMRPADSDIIDYLDDPGR